MKKPKAPLTEAEIMAAAYASFRKSIIDKSAKSGLRAITMEFEYVKNNPGYNVKVSKDVILNNSELIRAYESAIKEIKNTYARKNSPIKI